MRLDENGKSNIAQDINYFILERVEEPASERQYSDDLRHSVFTAIQNGAEGFFLWAALVIEEMKKKNRFELGKILKALPKGLPNIYGRMLLQIEKDCGPLAVLILRWVTGAYIIPHSYQLGDLIYREDLRSKGSHAVPITDSDIKEQTGVCGHLLSWDDGFARPVINLWRTTS